MRPIEDPDNGLVITCRGANGLAGVEGEGDVGQRPVTVSDEDGVDRG